VRNFYKAILIGTAVFAVLPTFFFAGLLFLVSLCSFFMIELFYALPSGDGLPSLVIQPFMIATFVMLWALVAWTLTRTMRQVALGVLPIQGLYAWVSDPVDYWSLRGLYVFLATVGALAATWLTPGAAFAIVDDRLTRELYMVTVIVLWITFVINYVILVQRFLRRRKLPAQCAGDPSAADSS
jgi:hypothetical protein